MERNFSRAPDYSGIREGVRRRLLTRIEHLDDTEIHLRITEMTVSSSTVASTRKFVCFLLHILYRICSCCSLGSLNWSSCLCRAWVAEGSFPTTPKPGCLRHLNLSFLHSRTQTILINLTCISVPPKWLLCIGGVISKGKCSKSSMKSSSWFLLPALAQFVLGCPRSSGELLARRW